MSKNGECQRNSYFEKRTVTALGCDFNRSMQHLSSNYGAEDVEDEAAIYLYEESLLLLRRRHVRAALVQYEPGNAA